MLMHVNVNDCLQESEAEEDSEGGEDSFCPKQQKKDCSKGKGKGKSVASFTTVRHENIVHRIVHRNGCSHENIDIYLYFHVYV